MMRSARAWEEEHAVTFATQATDGETSGAGGFDVVQGRGRALHSKLQDARKGQLNLHAFQMKTQVEDLFQGRHAELTLDQIWLKLQQDLFSETLRTW